MHSAQQRMLIPEKGRFAVVGCQTDRRGRTVSIERNGMSNEFVLDNIGQQSSTGPSGTWTTDDIMSIQACVEQDEALAVLSVHIATR